MPFLGDFFNFVPAPVVFFSFRQGTPYPQNIPAFKHSKTTKNPLKPDFALNAQKCPSKPFLFLLASLPLNIKKVA